MLYTCRPLHLTASLVDLPELTAILLEAGAKVDPPNNMHATPLFNACKSNNLFAAKFLLEKGTKVRQWMAMPSSRTHSARGCM